MAIITYSGQEFLFEASLCIREFELTPKEWGTYNWAKWNIHNMDYKPKLGFKRYQDMTRVDERLRRNKGKDLFHKRSYFYHTGISLKWH